MFDDKGKNLDVLQEECGELIVVVSKIKRFGLQNDYSNNREKLVQEIGDVHALMNIIKSDYNISDDEIEFAMYKKYEKLAKYYNYNGEVA